jgi:large conductance mechanosensitive channel
MPKPVEGRIRMINEFKKFALRGNLIDLAVAVILGLAFNAVVTALVDGVFMQLIAAVVGQPDFSELMFEVAGTPIRYGDFVTAVVNFVLIAFVLFLIVRAINRGMILRGEKEEPPKMRDCPFCLTSIPVSAQRCSACTSHVEPERV